MDENFDRRLARAELRQEQLDELSPEERTEVRAPRRATRLPSMLDERAFAPASAREPRGYDDEPF